MCGGVGVGVGVGGIGCTASQYEMFMLVSWCFKPGQPQRIISGLMETFIKRHIVEMTNKAEIRPEEQSEKVQSCPEDEIQLKGPDRWKQTQEQNKKEWESLVGLCQRHKLQHPRNMNVSPWG